MTADRWKQVSNLYHAALERPANERAEFLAHACDDDPELRREIESLLRYEAASDNLVRTITPEQSDERSTEDLEGSAVGGQIGSYHIQSLLGAGGMGVVYRARDPRLERDVAIKLLPAAFVGNAERLHRFEQEARAVAALDHSNIVAIHDIGNHHGTPYIVMECVPGETLAAHLSRGKLPVGRALEIGIEIADALAAAHVRGVIHRDLKPSNIMLTPDGRVKVLDFGLARISAADAVPSDAPTQPGFRTRAGQILGTPAYMSPEQLVGQQGNEQSDLYALGVILFELVTGQTPFEGDDFLTIGLTILTKPVPSASDVEPSVPPSVSALIQRTLAKEPAARPESAAALVAELTRLHDALDLSVEQPTPVPSLRPWYLRSRTYFPWAAAVIAIALVITGLSRWPSPTPTTASDRPVIAVLPMTNLTGDASKDYLGVGMAASLTTSLAKLSSVSVISPETTAESVRNTKDAAKLARDLGANLFVQGSLQQVGDRLRVSTQLVRPDGTIAWAGDVEAGQLQLFSIQRRIADDVIGAIRVAATASERTRLARPSTTDAGAQDLYWRGLAFLERNDRASVDLAISSFEAAVARDSQFAAAHAGLGRAYVRKNGYLSDRVWMTKALDAVSRALAIDPTQIDVRLSLANVYQFTGRSGAAVEELRHVLADQPSNDEAHRRLGEILMSEGRPAEALEHFQAAVGLRPQYWLNHNRLGGFFVRQGRLQEAIAAYTRVTELRPYNSEGYLELGTAFQASGDKVHARENLEKSIAIKPESAAYSNLGALHYSENRLEEAAAAFQAAIALRPSRPLYHRNLGDTYLKLGRPQDARSEYENARQLTQEALSVNPTDAGLMAQLAVYEAKLGHRRDARRYIDAAISINPESAEVLYRRAVVHALGGQTADAMSALSRAISSGYSKAFAAEDDDLTALKAVPEFRKLLESPNRPPS